MKQRRVSRDTPGRQGLSEDILGRLMRQHSTAAVLFHHAVAERMGLGPTDHKCLDLLRERGAMTGSELAAVTGLTTGAITGVVARLEQAGYLERKPDPRDGRKQTLRPVARRSSSIHRVFEPIRKELSEVLDKYDADELAVIADFLTRSTDLLYRHVGLLRAQTLQPRPDDKPPKGRRA